MPKCRICREPFTRVRPMQPACSYACEVVFAERKVSRSEKARAAAERKRLKAERQCDGERRQAQKKIPQLIAEAQIEFNKFIRLRDAGKPCICCGRPLGAGDVGGAYDCGHYRSTGSASHLRFDERNAHAQTKWCNRWGAGRAVDYRIGLIARVGREAVEALESDSRVRHWTREELIEIKKTYAAKWRALKAERSIA